MHVLPRPNWNAAVITPSATPKDSRFRIDAVSGMSRLRKTTRSSRKDSPITTARKELGHLGAQYLGVVLVGCRDAADVDRQRAARLRPGNAGSQPVKRGGCRGLLWSGGREHLGDLGLAVRAEHWRQDPGHTRLGAGRGDERTEACLVGGAVDLADHVQGPVEA